MKLSLSVCMTKCFITTVNSNNSTGRLVVSMICFNKPCFTNPSIFKACVQLHFTFITLKRLRLESIALIVKGLRYFDTSRKTTSFVSQCVIE